MSAVGRAVAAVALVLSTFAPALQGQVLVWEAASPVPPSSTFSNLYFGDFVYPMNDVNGDGFTDWLVPNDQAAPGGVAAAGWVGVLSGLDGSVLVAWPGVYPNEKAWAYGSPGDVDADGVWDAYIRRMTAAGVYYTGFYSGATGALIQSFAGGGGPQGRVWGLYDSDGDDVTEFVEVPSFWSGAFVKEGTSSTILVSMPSTGIDAAFGIDFRIVPDEDGDGNPDILAGLPGQRCITSTLWYGWTTGRLRVYSSATGAILKDFLGDAVCDRFGLGADTVGDVTGDGVRDYVIAQPGLNAIRTLDGASGATILSTSWPANCPVGCYTAPLAGVGDVDGDGVGDFVATHNAPGIPLWAEVRRSTDHAPLMTIPSPTIQGLPLGTGNRLAACGDEDGDGFFEVLVSSFGPPSGSGVLRKYSLRPVGIEPFGTGCGFAGGAPPRIAAGGTLSAGGTFTTSIAGVPGAVGVALAIGISQTSAFGTPLPLDLASIGAPGCALLTSPDIVTTTTATLRPDGTFGATIAVAIPAMPALAGISFYGQWAAFDAATGAVAVTRALAATVQT